MFYIMLDTCVLLDISTKRKDLPIVSALEGLSRDGILQLISSEVIKEEFDRRKEEVADKTRQRLTQEFKMVKNVVQDFGNDQKDQVVDALNEISSRLPILSEANHATITRVENLLESSIELEMTEQVKIASIQRGLDKKAPFHSGKNSVADSVIIEQFAEFVGSNRDNEDEFIFVTHNHHDFSAKDHRQPHEDFSQIFESESVHYFNNMVSAVNLFDEEILEEVQFEYDYTDETRGLFEILSAMDELVDKVWYNRHQNTLYHIEKGDTKIVPDGTKEYGSHVIHESILEGAKKAAKKVEEKYEDTGPWTDFEWGMINGKLSALRWVLGEDWDMLDT